MTNLNIDFDKDEFPNTELAILVAATHGEGDPTDNALRMFTWLKKAAKDKQSELLKKVSFSVFALGDTEYEKFCGAGKAFDEYLDKLGAKRVYQIGLGDTSNDLEGDFETWKKGLWVSLIDHWTKNQSEESKSQPQKEASRPKIEKLKYPLKMAEPGEITEEQQIQPLCIRQYVGAKDVRIESVRECKQTNKYGSCLEVIYDLEGTGLTYNTAANLAVFAENTEQDVERVTKRFGYDKDKRFVYVNAGDEKAKHPFPTPCTVGEALTKYCDLKGAADRKLFKDLSEFAKDDSDKEELIRLSKPEAKGDIEIMKQEYVSIMDILEKYESLDISDEVLLQMLPKMMPRYYTIASSSKLSPTKVRIAVSLSEFKSKKGREFIGLTSGYLKNIHNKYFREESKESVTSRLFFKDSLFEYPADPKSPIIMVGPGTGVVPFIAFSEERQYLKDKTPDIELGPAELYFGCKDRNHDYIYKEELAKFKEDGLITHIHEAYSREQENKVYVQDLIRLNKDNIVDLLRNQNAYFFMCGALEMGKSVEKTLEEIFGDDGKEFLTKIKDEKRFAKELWSD